MAKEPGESQPGSSGTSGLGTESLQSLIQSAVEKALEAERARTVSAGLTSSGEYTVEISPKTFGMTSLGSVDDIAYYVIYLLVGHVLGLY